MDGPDMSDHDPMLGALRRIDRNIQRLDGLLRSRGSQLERLHRDMLSGFEGLRRETRDLRHDVAGMRDHILSAPVVDVGFEAGVAQVHELRAMREDDPSSL